MYQIYDATTKSLEAELNGCHGKAYMSSFRRSVRECRSYLVREAEAYSQEAAARWIEERRNQVSHEIYKQLRYAQVLIAKRMAGDRFNVLLFYPDSYHKIWLMPEWTKSIINDFAEAEGQNFKNLNGLTNAACNFLLAVIQEGLRSLSEVSPLFVVTYCQCSGLDGQTSMFLIYLSEHGYVRPYTVEARIETYARFVILPEQEFETEYTIEEVYNAHQHIVESLGQQGYSDSVISVADCALTSFGIFLTANEIGYSKEAAEYFYDYYLANINKNVNHIRRPLAMLALYLEGKSAEDIPAVFVDESKRRHYPVWLKPYADDYRNFRQLNHIGESCLDSDRSAIMSFALYADENGCHDVNDITRDVLKAFNAQDIHGSMEGKNLYNRRIQRFMTFLYEENVIAEDIGSALPRINTAKSRPTRRLDDNTYNAILDYCSQEEARGNYLHSAVLKTALWTGLRSCDIGNLRTEDIDWEKMEFSIIQQKTGVFLDMPFPVDLGNVIWLYLNSQRSSYNKTDVVFVQDHAPYRPISRSITGNILSKATDGEETSFHVLRKTFATRMLEAGSDITGISDSLGHVSNDTVDAYLDAYGEKMQLCPLSLGLVPYEGGLL